MDGLHFSILVPSIEAVGERFDGGQSARSEWFRFGILSELLECIRASNA